MILMRKITRISLLFTLAAFIAACATAPPRSASEIAEDKKIEHAVIQQLAGDPSIYAQHIKVSVYRGVVTLSGYVLENREIFEAAQIAARVPGVTSVINEIKPPVSG